MLTKSGALLSSEQERSQGKSSDGNAGECRGKWTKLGSGDPHEQKGSPPDRRQQKQPYDITCAQLFSMECPLRKRGQIGSAGPHTSFGPLCKSEAEQAALGELERTVLTLISVAEVFYLVAKGMSQRDEESVMGLASKIVGHTHLEV